MINSKKGTNKNSNKSLFNGDIPPFLKINLPAIPFTTGMDRHRAGDNKIKEVLRLPNNKNDLLVPAADSRLDVFKYEIANELGYPLHIGERIATSQNWNQIVHNMKYEIAAELGLTPQIKNGYWGELSSKACGAVGGRIGGKLGGNMVRQIILFAEQNLIR